MRLAKGEAAGHRRADARRHGRLQRIHVEADVDAFQPVEPRQRAARHRGHAQFVDVAHGVDDDPAVRQRNAFLAVQVADGDHDDVLRPQLGALVAEVDQVRMTLAGQHRHRHAVNVAGGRRVGRVEVTVRVDPDDAERSVRRHAADRADGHGMVAAEEDGKVLRAATLGNVIDGLADRTDGAEMAHPAAARFHPALGAHGVLVAFRDVDVAGVVHIVAQAHEAIVEPGVAHRARPHVDAAALLTEVHGHADDLDVARVKIDRHGVSP